MIIGQPGVGKTVALAHLASLTANRDERLGDLSQRVPFLVHIADLKLPATDPKDVLKPIKDAAYEQAPVLDLGRLPSFIQATFKSGRALFLLDGFDELTADDQQVVSEYIKSLLQAHPKTRIVTTGAPEYLDGLVGLGFAPLSLLSWSEQRNAHFMERWGELWGQYVALETRTHTRPAQVDPILLNTWVSADKAILSPLELTLKVWGAYAGDSLGPHVLEAIATHIRRLAPSGTPLAALEALAMQVVLNGQPIFDPRQARQWVRAFEPMEEGGERAHEATQPVPGETAEETKPKIAKRGQKTIPTPTSGLLGKMASSGLLLSYPNNRMRFAHPVLKGYLAGRALSNYNANDALLNQPDWSGKYLAMRYLAAHGDVSPFVQKMMEWSRLPMHRPLLAAARWLRDAPHEAPWRGRLFTALADLLQTEGIPISLRGQALAAFVVSNDPGAAALCRQLANTLSYELAYLTALGSGAMKDTKAIPVLENMLKASNITVRRAACMALVAIGTTQAQEIVARTLLHADEDLRRVAAEALANDPGEGHAMLKDGATLQDVALRRAVAYGLARVDQSWAAELLQKLLVEDNQWAVRNSAKEALDGHTNLRSRAPHKLMAPSEATWLIEYASKQGVSIAPGTPGTEALLLALKSQDPDMRLAALPYLKYTPTEGVVSQMYGAMYKNDSELREAVYQTLWEIGASGFKLPNPDQYGLS
ncbi:MAG: hypothetical protein A2Z03_01490 [Chloroflexi bacterium RBG_16_56_8]|nr:MAG: hypothetical protein A2Z03_01490 [Chloroflexi bacterium RBG_16_56_8]